MTLEKAIKRMRECQDDGDIEAAHINADGILCEYLESLGAIKLVLEYHKVPKWYAKSNQGK